MTYECDSVSPRLALCPLPAQSECGLQQVHNMTQVMCVYVCMYVFRFRSVFLLFLRNSSNLNKIVNVVFFGFLPVSCRNVMLGKFGPSEDLKPQKIRLVPSLLAPASTYNQDIIDHRFSPEVFLILFYRWFLFIQSAL